MAFDKGGHLVPPVIPQPTRAEIVEHVAAGPGPVIEDCTRGENFDAGIPTLKIEPGVTIRDHTRNGYSHIDDGAFASSYKLKIRRTVCGKAIENAVPLPGDATCPDCQELS